MLNVQVYIFTFTLSHFLNVTVRYAIFFFYFRTPVRTIFEPYPEGIVSLAMTADAKYIATLSAAETQVSGGYF